MALLQQQPTTVLKSARQVAHFNAVSKENRRNTLHGTWSPQAGVSQEVLKNQDRPSHLERKRYFGIENQQRQQSSAEQPESEEETLRKIVLRCHSAQISKMHCKSRHVGYGNLQSGPDSKQALSSHLHFGNTQEMGAVNRKLNRCFLLSVGGTGTEEVLISSVFSTSSAVLC